MENNEEFEDTHNIEDTDIYKLINKNGDILYESDARKISNIKSNKKKNKHKKKKETKTTCYTKKNNNNNNGNNNNGYVIKIEEGEIEKQTLENKETYNTANKKDNNYPSENSSKFYGTYLEYLDINGLPVNLSQKSTNNSEKHVSELKSEEIISVKNSDSFLFPNQWENPSFPKVQNENKCFDLNQTIEMEKKIKEYDKNKIENIIEDVEKINENIVSLSLNEIINKYKEMESKNYEQNINFSKCIRTKFYDYDKKNLVLLGKKKKRNNKYFNFVKIV